MLWRDHRRAAHPAQRLSFRLRAYRSRRAHRPQALHHDPRLRLDLHDRRAHPRCHPAGGHTRQQLHHADHQPAQHAAVPAGARLRLVRRRLHHALPSRGMSTERAYEGAELDLFLAARNWKSYWSRKIRPHIGQTVLEVGAGFGSNTPYLHGESHARWVCLEPDAALVARIPDHLREYPWAGTIETRIGTLQDVPEAEKLDTLLYIDVLEHIEDDRAEM